MRAHILASRFAVVLVEKAVPAVFERDVRQTGNIECPIGPNALLMPPLNMCLIDTWGIWSSLREPDTPITGVSPEGSLIDPWGALGAKIPVTARMI